MIKLKNNHGVHKFSCTKKYCGFHIGWAFWEIFHDLDNLKNAADQININLSLCKSLFMSVTFSSCIVKVILYVRDETVYILLFIFVKLSCS